MHAHSTLPQVERFILKTQQMFSITIKSMTGGNRLSTIYGEIYVDYMKTLLLQEIRLNLETIIKGAHEVSFLDGYFHTHKDHFLPENFMPTSK